MSFPKRFNENTKQEDRLSAAAANHQLMVAAHNGSRPAYSLPDIDAVKKLFIALSVLSNEDFVFSDKLLAFFHTRSGHRAFPYRVAKKGNDDEKGQGVPLQ